MGQARGITISKSEFNATAMPNGQLAEDPIQNQGLHAEDTSRDLVGNLVAAIHRLVGNVVTAIHRLVGNATGICRLVVQALVQYLTTAVQTQVRNVANAFQNRVGNVASNNHGLLRYVAYLTQYLIWVAEAVIRRLVGDVETVILDYIARVLDALQADRPIVNAAGIAEINHEAAGHEGDASAAAGGRPIINNASAVIDEEVDNFRTPFCSADPYVQLQAVAQLEPEIDEQDPEMDDQHPEMEDQDPEIDDQAPMSDDDQEYFDAFQYLGEDNYQDE